MCFIRRFLSILKLYTYSISIYCVYGSGRDQIYFFLNDVPDQGIDASHLALGGALTFDVREGRGTGEVVLLGLFTVGVQGIFSV
jgi:hypothetical protein